MITGRRSFLKLLAAAPFPEALRLDDDSDRAAFRRWFTFLAEAQYFRAPGDLPRDISDCAALIRYAYREALHKHDDAWMKSLRLRLIPSIPAIRKFQDPDARWGPNLFRTGPGSFAQFADAKTLVRFNTTFRGRQVQNAQPADILFFKQLHAEARTTFHTMIYLGPSQVDRLAGPFLLYHTGPTAHDAGEIRRVTVSELEHHIDPEWRPIAGNTNFAGVYRWNLL